MYLQLVHHQRDYQNIRNYLEHGDSSNDVKRGIEIRNHEDYSIQMFSYFRTSKRGSGKRIVTHSISATMTLAPSSANRLQIASPKPEPPPVTIATLPSSRVPRTLGSLAIFSVLYEGEIREYLVSLSGNFGKEEGTKWLSGRANRIK